MEGINCFRKKGREGEKGGEKTGCAKTVTDKKLWTGHILLAYFPT